MGNAPSSNSDGQDHLSKQVNEEKLKNAALKKLLTDNGISEETISAMETVEEENQFDEYRYLFRGFPLITSKQFFGMMKFLRFCQISPEASRDYLRVVNCVGMATDAILQRNDHKKQLVFLLSSKDRCSEVQFKLAKETLLAECDHGE